MEREGPNAALAEILLKIADEYRSRNDVYRETAYRGAAYQIRRHPTPIASGAQAQREIRRIGKSIKESIDEYIKTGAVERLAALHAEVPEEQVPAPPTEKQLIVEYFQSFYGIGPAIAEKFYNAGYRTLADLWDSSALTPAQRLGILWREHLKLRIPRAEIDTTAGEIARLMPPNVHWEILGSYRRGEPESGDIDIAVKLQPDVNLDDVVAALSPLLVGDLAHGPSKYMGIFRLGPDWNAHRIDIRTFEPEVWPYAVMYFTGSQDFNILMRRRANDLGLNLSEYSLAGPTGSYPAEDERDIFRALGVHYMPPTSRRQNLTELPLSD